MGEWTCLKGFKNGEEGLKRVKFIKLYFYLKVREIIVSLSLSISTSDLEIAKVETEEELLKRLSLATSRIERSIHLAR